MSMCQSAITLITKALPTVNDDEKLLKIKSRIALFIQTMDVSMPCFERKVGIAYIAFSVLVTMSTSGIRFCSRYSRSTRSCSRTDSVKTSKRSVFCVSKSSQLTAADRLY